MFVGPEPGIVRKAGLDLMKPLLVALEEPVGFAELFDEVFGDGVLGVVGREPAVHDEFEFGGVFARDEDLFGAAAVGETVER